MSTTGGGRRGGQHGHGMRAEVAEVMDELVGEHAVELVFDQEEGGMSLRSIFGVLRSKTPRVIIMNPEVGGEEG